MRGGGGGGAALRTILKTRSSHQEDSKVNFMLFAWLRHLQQYFLSINHLVPPRNSWTSKKDSAEERESNSNFLLHFLDIFSPTPQNLLLASRSYCCPAD